MARSRKRRPGLPRRILLGLIWLPFLGAAGALVWYLSLPWPVLLRWREPATTSFLAYRVREARQEGKGLEIVRAWVPLQDISPNLQRAVLVAEDDRFYQHHGLDWRALAEEVRWAGDTTFSWFDPGDLRALAGAAAYYRTHRGEIKGRSTLTQQLAKNLYFTPERSLRRKLGEAIVAKRLEWFLPKDRILELYLNVVEWGPGLFGAEAAAQEYFHRSAASLTQEQGAALAATLPHPLTSNPSFRPSRMEWRRDLILARLRGGIPVPPPELEVPSLPPLLEPGTLPDTGSTPDTTATPDTLLPPDTTLHPDTVRLQAGSRG